MIVSVPVGAGLDAFSEREREKLGVLFAESRLKASKLSGRPVTIYSKFLRANYGRRYADLVRYLERVGVWRCVPYANELKYFDGHSRRFQVIEHEGEWMDVEISASLERAIKKRRQAQALEVMDEVRGGRFIVKAFDQLKLDTEAAGEWLDSMERVLKAGGELELKPSRKGEATPRERLTHRRLAVGWFASGGVCFNEHTGRVFSPLTNLPSELRPFLRVEGVERLALVDVSNSQPFVLCAMYAEATGDKRPLNVAAAGRFYEAVCEHCTLTRSEVKRGVLASLYGKHLKPRSEAGRALVAAFPRLWEWVCRQRAGAVHLAVRMQRVEAAWVLPVAGEFAKAGAFVATLHDALLVDHREASNASQMLAAAAVERWGVAPSFGVEVIEAR